MNLDEGVPQGSESVKGKKRRTRSKKGKKRGSNSEISNDDSIHDTTLSEEDPLSSVTNKPIESTNNVSLSKNDSVLQMIKQDSSLNGANEVADASEDDAKNKVSATDSGLSSEFRFIQSTEDRNTGRERKRKPCDLEEASSEQNIHPSKLSKGNEDGDKCEVKY